MKTTIDLPGDLLREMKLRAVQEGRKLKEVAAEIIRRGLSAPAPPPGPAVRRRVKPPIVPLPPGASTFDLTGQRVAELETASDLESHGASLRR